MAASFDGIDSWDFQEPESVDPTSQLQFTLLPKKIKNLYRGANSSLHVVTFTDDMKGLVKEFQPSDLETIRELELEDQYRHIFQNSSLRGQNRINGNRLALYKHLECNLLDVAHIPWPSTVSITNGIAVMLADLDDAGIALHSWADDDTKCAQYIRFKSSTTAAPSCNCITLIYFLLQETT